MANIPRRYHANLIWLNFLWNSGWNNNAEVWEGLQDLTNKLRPYLDGEPVEHFGFDDESEEDYGEER